MTTRPNLVLAGFMGAGKSTVGRIAAGRLGMPFVDTDALIEEGAGMGVREIFESKGEAYFRALESWVCKHVAGEGGQVIALGGGALLDHDNYMALLDSGVMILLVCRRDVLLSRLEGSALRGERPLLAGDFASRLDELMEARKGIYGKIDLALDTSELTPEEAADKVVEMYKRATHPVARRPLASSLGGTLHRAGSPLGATVVRVHSPSGEYKIYLGRRLLGNIGALLTPLRLGRRVVVATDSNVGALYGEKVVSTLLESEFDAHLVEMPAGEEHKSWESVELFLKGFLKAGLDRGGWVLALGGGVVGDTAGFAASIYMRGVPLVQMPTTLLAMADSSVGGKVGVDRPDGKNLLGAFKQPHLVLADLDMLATLPREQIACGMAEIIKAGVIADPTLFIMTENSAPNYEKYVEMLRRAIMVKRAIVERDPYESGDRALLNLGHTFGHAFERSTGYRRLHGFAVAQGMVVAARLAVSLGMCEASLEERLRGLLEKWGLPVRWGGSDLTGGEDVDKVWEAMLGDKKRRDDVPAFVLPEELGRVRLVLGIGEADVKRVLRETQ